MPGLFSWNCCHWCQNQVHPVGHLCGHHRTKEGSVSSPNPLLKNDKDVKQVEGAGVFASLKESVSTRKLLKTHVF